MSTSPRSIAETIFALELRLNTLNEQLNVFESELSRYPSVHNYEDDLFEDGVLDEYHIDNQFLSIVDTDGDEDIDSDNDDETVVYYTEYNYDYDSEDDTETLVGDWEDPFLTPEPWPLRRFESGWDVHEDW